MTPEVVTTHGVTPAKSIMASQIWCYIDAVYCRQPWMFKLCNLNWYIYHYFTGSPTGPTCPCSCASVCTAALVWQGWSAWRCRAIVSSGTQWTPHPGWRATDYVSTVACCSTCVTFFNWVLPHRRSIISIKASKYLVLPSENNSSSNLVRIDASSYMYKYTNKYWKPNWISENLTHVSHLFFCLVWWTRSFTAHITEATEAPQRLS